MADLFTHPQAALAGRYTLERELGRGGPMASEPGRSPLEAGTAPRPEAPDPMVLDGSASGEQVTAPSDSPTVPHAG